MKSNIRNTNIEILRFLLITSICFWHIIVHGYNFKFIGDGNSYPQQFGFLCSLLSPATYCFMFISGYYGMKYSWKKTKYFIFISFFCFFLGISLKYLLWGTIDLKYIATHIFPISTKTWWFLTCYMMIYFISPLITLGVETIEKENFKQILIYMTLIEMLSIISLKMNAGSNFYGLLYIYILGIYFEKYNINWTPKTNIILYVASLIFLTGITLFLMNLPTPYSKLAFVFLGYNNPLIIVMAITLFFLFRNLRPIYCSFVNKILSPILYVYLLTEMVGTPLYKFEARQFEASVLNGLVLSLSVIAFCLTTGHIGNYIYNSFCVEFERRD